MRVTPMEDTMDLTLVSLFAAVLALGFASHQSTNQQMIRPADPTS